MDVTIIRLVQCIDRELSSIDLSVTPISQTCIDSVLMLFDEADGKLPFLIEMADRLYVKYEEAKSNFQCYPSEVTQYNYSSLQLICLSLEMSSLV